MLPDHYRWFPPVLLGAYVTLAGILIFAAELEPPGPGPRAVAVGLLAGALAAVGWFLVGRAALARDRLAWAFDPSGLAVLVAVLFTALPWANFGLGGPAWISWMLMWPVRASIYYGSSSLGVTALLASPIPGFFYVMGVAHLLSLVPGALGVEGSEAPG